MSVLRSGRTVDGVAHFLHRLILVFSVEDTMADRYNERDDRDRGWRDAGEYSGRGQYNRSHSRDRDWDPGHWTRRDYVRDDDRGFIDRAGDEVRSWFGDEDAARRREMDERRETRDRERPWTRDENWRHVPERERYRISDDWDQREYSARATGTSWGTSAGTGDWRGRAPNRGEWRDWRGESRRTTPSYTSEPYQWGGGGEHLYGPGVERMRTGPHAGKGPRGYQRSDDRICEEICDLLTRDPGIDASAVDVAVTNGEVTLSGNVDSRYEKRASEDVADSVQGVRHVHNELRVNNGRPRNEEPAEAVTPKVTK
jgi:osmotically-inducible protein OsmY